MNISATQASRDPFKSLHFRCTLSWETPQSAEKQQLRRHVQLGTRSSAETLWMRHPQHHLVWGTKFGKHGRCTMNCCDSGPKGPKGMHHPSDRPTTPEGDFSLTVSCICHLSTITVWRSVIPYFLTTWLSCTTC